MDYDQIKELIKTQNNSQGIDIAGIVRIILKKKNIYYIIICVSFISRLHLFKNSCAYI